MSTSCLWVSRNRTTGIAVPDRWREHISVGRQNNWVLTDMPILSFGTLYPLASALFPFAHYTSDKALSIPYFSMCRSIRDDAGRSRRIPNRRGLDVLARSTGHAARTSSQPHGPAPPARHRHQDKIAQAYPSNPGCAAARDKAIRGDKDVFEFTGRRQDFTTSWSSQDGCASRASCG